MLGFGESEGLEVTRSEILAHEATGVIEGRKKKKKNTVGGTQSRAQEETQKDPSIERNFCDFPPWGKVPGRSIRCKRTCRAGEA